MPSTRFPGGAFGKQEGSLSIPDTLDRKPIHTATILERSAVRVHLIRKGLLLGFWAAIGSELISGTPVHPRQHGFSDRNSVRLRDSIGGGSRCRRATGLA